MISLLKEYFFNSAAYFGPVMIIMRIVYVTRDKRDDTFEESQVLNFFTWNSKTF